MPCYSPIKGWRTPDGRVTFSKSHGYGDLQATVACGRCVGCRLERARQFAVRCMHEAQLHDENCFITLTYRDRDLPEGGTLVRRAVPDFMKRLRRRVCRYFKDEEGNRFVDPQILSFYCGEYGEKLSRPHYHALLFGFAFPDKVPLPRGASKSPLFRSPLLESLWPFGQSSIGPVCFETAAYVARYSVKKVGGDSAAAHYSRVDVRTGEIFQVLPEFMGCSTRPAIGLEWFRRFGKEVFPDDFVVAKGREVPVPKYYEKLVKRGELQHVQFDEIRSARRDRFVREVRPGERSPRRLDDKRQVKLAELNLYRRELDK